MTDQQGTAYPLPYHSIMPAHFKDASGRTLLLHGVNLADGKFPTSQPSHLLSSLDTSVENSSKLSYVDSPLPLADADAHLAKLRSLGFNALRLPVVWEALEHAGPGVYDDEHIAYITSLVRLCNAHGFRVLINAHQDLFSRFSGGSGAPLWTLHACGLDPDGFADTHAAIRYAEWPVDGDAGGKGRGEDPKAIPPMMWTSNHSRLACGTLFALFWAGGELAPRCVLDGVNIQEYLQSHYFAAYGRLAEALGDLAFGWDSMNEPEPGFVGWGDLAKNEREASAMMGSAPTPVQAMRLGVGMEQTVDRYRLGKTGPHKDGTMTIRPGRACWLRTEDSRSSWGWQRAGEWTLGTCVWALHGVWDPQTGELKRPGYFAGASGGGDWKSKYWKPFFDGWTATVCKYSAESVVFIQPPIFEPPPPNLLSSSADLRRLGYSPHFYDALTVMKGHWNKYWNVDILRLLRGPQDTMTKIKAFKIGPGGVRTVISQQLGAMACDVETSSGEKSGQPLVPTLIGETGIPFNLDDGKAYEDGDYSSHVAAFDTILGGCDDHLLNYTLWAYSAVNSHEWGDHWNGEDLSIYNSETRSFTGHKFLAGCRGAAAWCRPYVQSLDGGILTMAFDLKTSMFVLEIDSHHGGSAVIYTPWLHYRRDDESDELDLKITASAGQCSYRSETQLLNWAYGSAGKIKIAIERAGGPLSPQSLGTVIAVR